MNSVDNLHSEDTGLTQLLVHRGAPDVLVLKTNNIPLLYKELIVLRNRDDHPQDRPREIWVDLSLCSSNSDIRADILVRALRIAQFLPQGFVGNNPFSRQMAKGADLPHVDFAHDLMVQSSPKQDAIPLNKPSSVFVESANTALFDGQNIHGEMEQAEAIIADFQRRLSSLHNTFEDARHRESQSSLELDRLRVLHQDLQDDCVQWKARTEQLSADLQVLDQNHIEVQEDLVRIQQVLAIREEELTINARRLNNANQENELARRALAQSEEELEATKNALNQLKNSSREELESIQSHLEQVNHDLTVRHEEAKMREVWLQEEVAKQKTTAQNAVQDLNVLQKRFDEAEVLMRQTCDQTQVLSEENKALHRQSEDQNAALLESQNRNGLFEERYQETVADSQKTLEQLFALQNSYSKIEVKLQETQNDAAYKHLQLENSLDQIALLDANLNDAVGQLKQAEKDMNEALNLAQAYENEKLETQEHSVVLQKMLNDATARFDLQSEQKSALHEEVASLKHHIEALEDQRIQLQSHLNEQILAYEKACEEVAQTQQRVAEQNREIEAWVEQIQAGERDLEQSIVEKNQLQHHLNDALASVANQENQVEALNRSVDGLKQQLFDLNQARDVLLQQLTQADQTVAGMIQTHKDNQKILAHVRQEVASYQEQLLVSQKQLQAAQAGWDRAKEENGTRSQQMQQLLKSNSALIADLNEARDHIVELTDARLKVANQLENAYQEHLSQNEVLKQEIQLWKDRLSCEQDSVKTLKQEIVQLTNQIHAFNAAQENWVKQENLLLGQLQDYQHSQYEAKQLLQKAQEERAVLSEKLQNAQNALGDLKALKKSLDQEYVKQLEEVASLKDVVTKQQEKFSGQTQEMIALENQISQLQEKEVVLQEQRQQIESLEGTVSEQQALMDQQQQAIQRLQSERLKQTEFLHEQTILLSRAEQALADAQKNSVELKATLESSQKHRELINDQLSSLKQTHTALQKEFDDQGYALLEKEEELTNTQENLTALTTQHETLRQNYDETLIVLNQAQTQLTHDQNVLHGLSEQFAEQEQTLRQEQLSHEEVKQALSVSQSRAQNLQENLTDREDRLAEQETALVDLRSQFVVSQSELQNKTLQFCETRERLTQSEALRAELEGNFISSEHALRQTVEALTDAQSSWKETQLSLEKTQQQLNETHQDLLFKNGRVEVLEQAVLEALQTQEKLTQTEALRAELENNFISSEHALRQKVEALADAQLSWKEAQLSLEKTQQQLNETHQDLLFKNGRVEVLEQAVLEALQTQEGLSGKVLDLTEKLLQESTAHDALKHQLNEVQLMRDQFQAQCVSLEENVSVLTVENQALNQALNDLTQSNHQLQVDFKEASETVVLLREELTQSQHDLETTRQDLVEARNVFEETLQSRDGTIDGLSLQNKELNSLASLLEKRLGEHLSKVQMLTAECDMLRNNNLEEQLQEALTGRDRAVGELQKVRLALDDSERQRVRDASESLLLRQDLLKAQSQTDYLTKTLDQAQGNLEKVSQSHVDNSQELTQLRDELAQALFAAQSAVEEKNKLNEKYLEARQAVVDVQTRHAERLTQAVNLKVDHHPNRIRGGQEVTGQGDLVISQAVSEGARIEAEGTVHIYGPMHGSVHAGYTGNKNARIYCLNFAAHSVAIAGRFYQLETLPEDLRGKAVEIWLDQEKDVLCIASIY